MPKIYSFYSRNDQSQESVGKIVATNRLSAAKYFAAIKRMSLKQFLSVFEVSK
jgi:hypothetical protein